MSAADAGVRTAPRVRGRARAPALADAPRHARRRFARAARDMFFTTGRKGHPSAHASGLAVAGPSGPRRAGPTRSASPAPRIAVRTSLVALVRERRPPCASLLAAADGRPVRRIAVRPSSRSCASDLRRARHSAQPPTVVPCGASPSDLRRARARATSGVRVAPCGRPTVGRAAHRRPTLDRRARDDAGAHRSSPVDLRRRTRDRRLPIRRSHDRRDVAANLSRTRDLACESTTQTGSITRQWPLRCAPAHF
ncbi:hypothetical protein SAMN02745121_01900 [Nannocystis exedens]|uniref:Uncharacterized protein n=1 Tax=Nannocystis exedens TaxID=54 RepID=A0A1I1VUG2_9BACT|nr:hypothetical protein NAEX_05869 [Nannocystis exedens]SFD85698.1 hypothetical protein SAMN02745121_01900 [Nannocystis exedens]